MNQVWKYELKSLTPNVLAIPRDAQFLALQLQNGAPMMWFSVNPDAPKQERIFNIVGTGHEVPETAKYFGTIQIREGAIVLHVFEF